MADITKLNGLWARVADANARGQARIAELDAKRDRSPAPGDVYLWLPANDYVTAWVVVSDHPADGEFAYVVPADEYPLTGLADLAVRDAGTEALFVRCGRGN